MIINTISAPSIEVVTVPAGEFVLGPGPLSTTRGVQPNPEHTIPLATYQIGRYPVTNAQYQAFVQDTGHRPPLTWDQEFPADQADHPVAGVMWAEAWLFCAWLALKTGRPYHLPTEAEWEKAASWNPTTGKKQRFPWGEEEDSARCNFIGSGIKGTTPVGRYSPQGDSPYGCADMIGNVDEWCNTELAEYPYLASDGREELRTMGRRGTRGGDWNSVMVSANRRNAPSDWWGHLWGFRVALGDSLKDAHRDYRAKVEQYVADTEARNQASNAEEYYGHGTWRLNLAQMGLPRYEGAIDDLSQALKLGTANPASLKSPRAYAFYNRGAAKFHLKRYAEAADDLGEALKLDPKDADAFMMRAQSHAQLGQIGDAERDLAAALGLNSNHPSAATTRTYIAKNGSDHQETIRLCTEIINRPMFTHLHLTEAHLWRGNAYEKIGQMTEALSDYYHFVLWEPEAPETPALKARLNI